MSSWLVASTGIGAIGSLMGCNSADDPAAPTTPDNGAIPQDYGASVPQALQSNGWDSITLTAGGSDIVIDGVGHFKTTRNLCTFQASFGVIKSIDDWNALAQAANDLAKTQASDWSSSLPDNCFQALQSPQGFNDGYYDKFDITLSLPDSAQSAVPAANIPRANTVFRPYSNVSPVPSASIPPASPAPSLSPGPHPSASPVPSPSPSSGPTFTVLESNGDQDCTKTQNIQNLQTLVPVLNRIATQALFEDCPSVPQAQ